MQRKKPTHKDLRQLVRDYREGNLSQELIAALEQQSGKTIDKLVFMIEVSLLIRDHHLDNMTLPQLRQWRKYQGDISEEEKQTYAHANGCTYEEFSERALHHLEMLEHRKVAKDIAKDRRRWDGLVAEGKAAAIGENCYVAPLENIL